RTLAGDARRAAPMVAAFRDSPEAARRMCLLLGTSRLLHAGFVREPEAVRMTVSPQDLAASTPEALAERAAAVATRGRGLVRLRESEVLRTAARDILGVDSVEQTARSLTALAEAVLDAALA